MRIKTMPDGPDVRGEDRLMLCMRPEYTNCLAYAIQASCSNLSKARTLTLRSGRTRLRENSFDVLEEAGTMVRAAIDI